MKVLDYSDGLRKLRPYTQLQGAYSVSHKMEWLGEKSSLRRADFDCNLYRCSVSVSIRKATPTPILATKGLTTCNLTPTGAQSTYRIVRLSSDGADGICVPDDQISIGADGDPTLARIQVQDFGSVGAGDGHEHVFVHLPCSLKCKFVSLCCSCK